VNRLPLNIKAILGKYKAFFLNVKSMEPVKRGRHILLTYAFAAYILQCRLLFNELPYFTFGASRMQLVK
jgi:hypothetical protein